MAVARQATGSAAATTAGSTLRPAWPAHQAGDVALLFVESQANEATLSDPIGFTKLGSTQAATGTRLDVFWCRATSSSMATPTVASNTNHLYAVIITYRGAIPTGDPFSSWAGAVKSTASTTDTLPAVTTAIDNQLIVLAATKDLDSTAAFVSAATNANLTGLAERFDAGTISGNGGGLGIYDGTKATAGDTGTTAFTVTSSASAMMTIALLPEIAKTGTAAVTNGGQQSTAGSKTAKATTSNSLGSQQTAVQVKGGKRGGVSHTAGANINTGGKTGRKAGNLANTAGFRATLEYSGAPPFRMAGVIVEAVFRRVASSGGTKSSLRTSEAVLNPRQQADAVIVKTISVEAIKNITAKEEIINA